mmetsp:Transcript_32734/g.101337  ORF Transcript_32734/g.101337 Transcript_32734/m.101337 type:complete len:303 (+) Transcript_32734:2238-3146(+)
MLFEDMLMVAGREDEILEMASKAISFRYWFHDTENEGYSKKQARATATILVSKRSCRYRVQSTCLPALWLALDELTNRVKLQDAEIKLSYTEKLPLTDFYAVLDEHYNSRQAVRVAESSLNNCAYQYRIIQKRLLIRFKDSRPAMLGPLDLMLRQTHRKLLHLASGVDTAQNTRSYSAHNLGCTTRILLALMKMRFNLSSIEYDILCSHLNPSVVELNLSAADEPGWEETTDVALDSILNSSLSTHILLMPGQFDPDHLDRSTKNSKKRPTALLPSFPTTTAKLKRHIAMLCDRLEQRQILG